MSKEWESPRDRAKRREAIVNALGVIAALILIGLSYSVAFKPLPANLEQLALSSAAIARLRGEVSE